MTFSEFIASEIFLPRLREFRILVVYDEFNRYHEVCQSLASDQCTVILADKRPISAREEAMRRWIAMGDDTTFQSQMLIHCSEKPPLGDEKQQEPFAGYTTTGGSFPSKASDGFKDLCHRFLIDRRTEIDQLFAGDTEPTFDLIDNLSSAEHSHPRLQTIFGTSEVSKILLAFLGAPSGSHDTQLSENTDWIPEIRNLAQRTLNLILSPQIEKVDTIRKKLWQHLLFSEFSSDLPCDLPSSLREIPKAEDHHLNLIKSLCQDLRCHSAYKEAYRDAANAVEKSLDLENECKDISDLGETDTFAFEERNFLHLACISVRAGLWDDALKILETHKNSLWTEEGERQLLWRILELGLKTQEEISRAEKEHFKRLGHSGVELVQLYNKELIKIDSYYRELEEAIAQTHEGYEEIHEIVEASREAYQAHFNRMQGHFLGAVKREGWPLPHVDSNIDSYGKLAAPALKEGKRIVYLMIDALRLDLAQSLTNGIKDHNVEQTFSCAQLPCVTRFGMASLVPDAPDKLNYRVINGELKPFHEDTNIEIRSERLQVFSSTLNDRVTAIRLDELLSKTRTPKGLEKLTKELADVDLLVITSTEIDELGDQGNNLHHMPEKMRDLRLGISRCAALNYDQAVVVTDHGFVYTPELDQGSVCQKPSGDWALSKRRCLIGTGDTLPGTERFSCQDLGLPTDLPAFVVPSSLATFRAGSGYFHEGLSLQESLVPKMVITFNKNESPQAASAPPEIELGRKKKTVSSSIVSFNISWPVDALLFQESRNLKIVATQSGKEIGEPTSNERVDPLTSLVSISPSEAFKINVRLNDELQEGSFQIKAIDTSTGKTLASLDLEYKTYL
ncbi:PglZ domain-containing protein [Akkermansiaceae bacterium]|nr:PglZ domain-containing protein [Akkermansiaceae bacterium]